MKASEIRWHEVKNFSASEWPADTLDLLDARVVFVLDDLRNRLGKGIYPSPLKGAWVRESGSPTSRHYAVNRLSDAGDFFTDAHVLDAFLHAQAISDIGGVGVYLDTFYRGVPQPMMHIDLRQHGSFTHRQFWLRWAGTYYYPMRGGVHREQFWKLLAEHGI